MADNKETVKEQIKALEEQKKNTETMYFKLQGAIEALTAVLPEIDKKEESVKNIKKK
ncbi:MAG: hypothetical protein Unbinned5123contig1000_50 [Prokaryotic dsDNA virus sp.]|nr:MAG: hypothetical protein Unbinned5123contig1000_50 [Prokaryotic dsDNA virus sp.]|tara:strand:+ start:5011 stop:5181 length:171 start_codon:yes stop_codon:yes gene_type:complete